MSALNDISNSDAGFDSNSVPISKIDHSDKYKPNPQKPVEAVALLLFQDRRDPTTERVESRTARPKVVLGRIIGTKGGASVS